MLMSKKHKEAREWEYEKGKRDMLKSIKRFLNNSNNLHYAENNRCSVCENKLGKVIDVKELNDFLEKLK